MATKASAKKTQTAKPTVNGVVDDVLKRRAQALRARARALAELPAAGEESALFAAPKRTAHLELVAEAAKFTSKGWLIAEGDSWFDYPGTSPRTTWSRSRAPAIA